LSRAVDTGVATCADTAWRLFFRQGERARSSFDCAPLSRSLSSRSARACVVFGGGCGGLVSGGAVMFV
jgi:hypothetical protein